MPRDCGEPDAAYQLQLDFIALPTFATCLGHKITTHTVGNETMKNVVAIIDILGGLAHLRDNPITLRVAGFMPLHIEYVGKGPRGGMMVSVMHTFEQNGDLMRDPDLVAELMLSGEWLPISYRQDSLGVFQDAVLPEGDQILVNTRLAQSISQFMVVWDMAIGQQGYVEEAKRRVGC